MSLLNEENLRLSALQLRDKSALYVRNGCFHYGFKKNKSIVFDGLNMTVPKGSVYSLLGASGCGKATLLNCILGYNKLNSGRIWVLGGTPGSKSCGVPGTRVGYMPQEVGLYGCFTVRETLTYYGWIAGMTSKKIQDRFENLNEVLMLPNSDQMVTTLSGGQKRRVSLASAMLHEPELLILDEPTVGLDPIVRESIWEYLIEITKKKGTTIIITTHYIEEAQQAHLVGLMRGGRLLVEKAPEALIIENGVETLEEVFLKLSIMQNMNHRASSSSSSTLNDHFLPQYPSDAESTRKLSDYLPHINGNHMKALIWKGFLWMRRNILVMLIMLLLPITQFPLAWFSLGHFPTSLPVAVVNYETNNSRNCNSELTCNTTQLSCSYFSYLGENALIVKYFDSEDEARKSVLNGKTYASIVIKHNYSAALRARLRDWESTDDWNMNYSEIDVFRDVAEKQISDYLKEFLYNTFLNFIQDFVQICGENKRALMLPVKFETPVYGLTHVDHYTDYLIVGCIVWFVCLLGVAMTAITMLVEYKESSMLRTFAIGITDVELLTSHAICELLVIIIQIVIAFACIFLFDVTVKGSIVLAFALLLVVGIFGMSYGYFISCICQDEYTANFLAIGSLVPMQILCGIAWPIEAMQMFTSLIPVTTATNALRSIFQRAWSFNAKVVYMSFGTIVLFTIVILMLSILALRFRRFK